VTSAAFSAGDEAGVALIDPAGAAVEGEIEAGNVRERADPPDGMNGEDVPYLLRLDHGTSGEARVSVAR
jgi:hypothetical protein